MVCLNRFRKRTQNNSRILLTWSRASLSCRVSVSFHVDEFNVSAAISGSFLLKLPAIIRAIDTKIIVKIRKYKHCLFNIFIKIFIKIFRINLLQCYIGTKHASLQIEIWIVTKLTAKLRLNQWCVWILASLCFIIPIYRVHVECQHMCCRHKIVGRN